MRFAATVPLLLAALAGLSGRAAGAQPAAFTDEQAFLAALPALGGTALTEGFEGPSGTACARARPEPLIRPPRSPVGA